MNTLLFLSMFLLLNMNCLAFRQNDLVVTYTKTDVSCAGQNNGSITLSIMGGKEPYTVKWKQGQNDLSLNNLSSGNYAVEIEDAKGKSVKHNITIEEPAPLGFYYRSNVLTHVDEFNGIMDISIFGGNPWILDNCNDYFVRLNGKSYYENPENIKNGLYDLSIEDAKGCTFSLKVNIHVEVVKSVHEVASITTDHTYRQNSFGTINMFVIHHPLKNASLLQNNDFSAPQDFSIR